jgi:hypothetical protein
MSELLSCASDIALVTYVLLFDCEAMICEAYSESSGVHEMCASPGVSICRHLECASTLAK